jgi:hypothetical protein
VDQLQLWRETAIDQEVLVAWMQKEKPKITGTGAKLHFLPACGSLDFSFTLNDGKTFCHRIIFDGEVSEKHSMVAAALLIDRVKNQVGIKITL